MEIYSAIVKCKRCESSWNNTLSNYGSGLDNITCYWCSICEKMFRIHPRIKFEGSVIFFL